MLDGHIHIAELEKGRDGFAQKLKAAGIDGGVIISLPPKLFQGFHHNLSNAGRLDNLKLWAQAADNLYSFYWIDPMEDDATEQVKQACQSGVEGFKVICNYFYPGDKQAMKVFRVIAEAGKPILFHSGILWDGRPSSCYNRPGEFEALLEIDRLKFCLAHVSWPWCDELIAVYGKFLNAYSQNRQLSVEMFVDITPGTPKIYRREVLTKLFTVGYDIEHNVIFGSDSYINDYNVDWVQEWICRDNEIYHSINLPQSTLNALYGENLKRFIGVSSEKIQRKSLKQGQ